MSQKYTAFFYGTLLHPAILRRVIGHEGQKLEICPALLLVSISAMSCRDPLPKTELRG